MIDESLGAILTCAPSGCSRENDCFLVWQYAKQCYEREQERLDKFDKLFIQDFPATWEFHKDSNDD